jgi:hypothetical protein
MISVSISVLGADNFWGVLTLGRICAFIEQVQLNPGETGTRFHSLDAAPPIYADIAPPGDIRSVI